MRQHTRLLFAAGLLTACAAASPPPNDESEAAKAAVLKHAAQVGKKSWAELVKEAAPVARKHELFDLMGVLRKRDPEDPRSGLGVGARPGAIKPDGIDAKLIRLAGRVRPADLENAKDLIRMAEVTAALASITFHRNEPVFMKRQKWEQLCTEMHDASLDFIDAVKGKDITKVENTARILSDTCAACHRPGVPRLRPAARKPIPRNIRKP